MSIKTSKNGFRVLREDAVFVVDKKLFKSVSFKSGDPGREWQKQGISTRFDKGAKCPVGCVKYVFYHRNPGGSVVAAKEAYERLLDSVDKTGTTRSSL